MLYPAAKVIIRNENHKNMILLAQRVDEEKDHYELAGGRIDVDFSVQRLETFENCAIREVQEELGITVDLKQYVGSFYFFWYWDANKKACICTVFEGIIADTNPLFVTNKDNSEGHLNPAWVSMHDILNGSISFDPMYVGLEQLIKDYCRRNII